MCVSCGETYMIRTTVRKMTEPHYHMVKYSHTGLEQVCVRCFPLVAFSFFIISMDYFQEIFGMFSNFILDTKIINKEA